MSWRAFVGQWGDPGPGRITIEGEDILLIPDEADTVKVTLFNNSVIPDEDATLANSGYNTGQWFTAYEVT